MSLFFFFFNDTATTEIYTLSLHDALPIFDTSNLNLGPLSGTQITAGRTLSGADAKRAVAVLDADYAAQKDLSVGEDRKSTRLNSSHTVISYAVFCLKKKKKKKRQTKTRRE